MKRTTLSIFMLLFTMCLMAQTLHLYPGDKEKLSQEYQKPVREETRPPGIDQFVNQHGWRSGRIVGGENAQIEDYPWQVALMQETTQFCGGSIINEQWILTAAHCLDDNWSAEYVRAGVTDRTNETGQDITVDQYIIHPDYGYPATFSNDIALIKLTSPLDLSDPAVSKIDLVTPDEANAGLTDPGTMAWITGWGALWQGGPSSDILQVAEVPIVSNQDAMDDGEYNPGSITEDMLVAGYIEDGEVDACQGDSGGPLVVLDGSGNYKLAGVTSWGVGCAMPGYPGVYARVSIFTEWIESYVPFAHADAPGNPTNLVAEAGEQGVLTVDISWNNPHETAGGEPLTNLNTVHLYRNNELLHSVSSAAVGDPQSFSDNDITEPGLYSYSVFGVNDAGEGLTTTVFVYVGEDLPGYPTNALLIAQDDNGSLSWEAPLSGINGGYIDSDDITYTLVRMSDNAEVASNITDTSFVDTQIPGMGNYHYEITAVNSIGEGGTTLTNPALLQGSHYLMFETFDYQPGNLPSGWQLTGLPHGWSVRNSSNAGGQAPELRLHWSPEYTGMSRLVTYPIFIENHSEIRLSFQHALNNHYENEGEKVAIDVSYDEGSTWQNIWELAFTHDIAPETIEEFFDLPQSETTMQLGFRFEGNSYNIDQWYVDNVIIEPLVENDLVAESISGTPTPSEGAESLYTISVKNAGTQTQSNYTVKLMQQGDIEIATVDGQTIEFGETIEYELPWTPTPDDIGETYLYGYVSFDEDQAPVNNQTQNLDVSVQSGDFLALTIGDEELLTSLPYNFIWHYSLSQTLYYPDEIDLSSGILLGIQYYNNFDTLYLDRDIQIWLGETDAENLDNGWIDYDSMQLVFDGTVDFPAGENTIFIEFDQPYIYGGGTLVIYSYKQDTEWTGGQNFYNSNDEESGRTRRAYQDNTPIDPANPPLGSTEDEHPNITLFFAASDVGALTGTVTDSNNPLEGAEVHLPEINLSTLTNEEGYYEFPFLFPGSYQLEFSKYGYEDLLAENVEVIIDQTTVFDATMNVLEQFYVTGTIERSDGGVKPNALVVLEGYENYAQNTDSNGNFFFEQVFEGNYTLSVISDNYQTYTDENIEISQNTDLGTIVIERIFPVPESLAIDLADQQDGNVLFSWHLDTGTEFRWDDGTAVTELGSGGGTWNTVLGSVHPNNAVLNEMSWYLSSEGGPHDEVKIWVFGLDANGYPNPGDLLYQMEAVSNLDEQWNTYEFSQPVEAPNGFLIGLSYNGFLGLAADSGTDAIYPFQSNTHFYAGNYNNGFNPVENLDFYHNFLIRAFGEDLGELSPDETQQLLPTKHTETDKLFTGFNVYLNDSLVAYNLSESQFLFEGLEPGLYTAGVQSNFTSGVSDTATIDFLIEAETFMLTLSAEPEGGGTISGSGMYQENELVNITATANEGYEFSHWADHLGEISNQANFEYTMPGEDVSLTAHFIQVTDEFSVTFNVNMETALGFDPSEEMVFITGSMFDWAPPGHITEEQTMTRIDDSMIWTITMTLEADMYQYNYYINTGWNGSEWGDERIIEVDSDMTINDEWTHDGTFVNEYEFSTVNVFPNPAHGKFTITADEIIRTVTISDITGKMVFRQAIKGSQYEFTNYLHNGVYIIKILTDNNVYFKKLQIKN